MKATGTNTESNTIVIPTIGAVMFRMALRRLCRREFRMLLHLRLDRLDHDDRVIHHDADRQHDREQRDGVGRITDRVQHDERADEADRHGDGRDQRGAEIAKEEEHHQHDQDECLDQGLFHLVDRRGDEGRRIVGDLPGEILGEILRRVVHQLPTPRSW